MKRLQLGISLRGGAPGTLPGKHALQRRVSSWSSAVLTWMMLAVLLASPGMLRAGQMEDLQGDDLPTRLEALRELRTDPDKTRLAILEILSAPLDTAGAKKARKTTALPPEKTARLVYHFTEFALPEDMGLLAQLLEKTEHDIVRKALENTLKALYQPTGAVEQLSFLTQDLTFVQEGQPRLIENKLSGRWFYTPWSYRVLHREGLSTEMIERLSPFANRSFESREEALEEIKKALKPGEWTKYEALLSEAIDKVEDRAEISGRVRVRLTNPLQTPVMVRLWLHVWYGLFRNAPPEPMVFLAPGASKRIDLPVHLSGVRPEKGLRVDLEIREVNGPPLKSFHPLPVPLSY